jgi:hypothetical protein
MWNVDEKLNVNHEIAINSQRSQYKNISDYWFDGLLVSSKQEILNEFKDIISNSHSEECRQQIDALVAIMKVG